MPKISSKVKKIPKTNSARAFMEAKGFSPLEKLIEFYEEELPMPDTPEILRTMIMMGREPGIGKDGATVLKLGLKYRFEALREMAGYYDAKVKATDAAIEGESHGLIVEINNTMKAETKELPQPDHRQIQN